MTRSAVVAALWSLGLFAVALGVRLHQHHAALLYPDGYQYLLMARGISEHLEPMTVLGPGGDAFAPSPDAAAKPLFPLLVAAVHALGVSWLDAARTVTTIAGAWAVTALALLVSKVGGSRLAGAAAGLLLLASPSLGFWSGFSGPDPLAQALVLTAALAFVYRRSRLGGVLAGLAIAARPEIVVLAIAASVVSLRSEEARRELGRAAPAAIVTASLVFFVLRTPIAIADWRLVWPAALLLVAIGLATVAPLVVLRYAAIAAVGVAAIFLFTQAGPAELWHDDWPLLILGGVGSVVLIHDARRSVTATLVLGVVLLLGAVYVLKNPTAGRYFSLLLPAAAILAGIAVTSLPQRGRALALGAIALVAVAGFVRPVPGSRDYDMFSVVAKRVAPRLGSAALVTAAPDAYGFWLPTHPVRRMRPGVHGAVLLDATQRLFDPGLTAKGRVVARISDEIAFSRPNREIDADPAVLVAGTVVARASQPARYVPDAASPPPPS